MSTKGYSFAPTRLDAMAWDGAVKDMTAFASVTITCLVTPDTPYTVYGGPGEDAQQSRGVTIGAEGRYDIPGAEWLSLDGGSGGSFTISGAQSSPVLPPGSEVSIAGLDPSLPSRIVPAYKVQSASFAGLTPGVQTRPNGQLVVDAADYSEAILAITDNTGGNTLTFGQSHDGSNFTSLYGQAINFGYDTLVTNTTTGTSFYRFTDFHQYIEIRISNFVSGGSVSVSLILRSAKGSSTYVQASSRAIPQNKASRCPTPLRIFSAATDNVTLVKGSEAVLNQLALENVGASTVYFKLYNKATAPGSGDTPVETIALSPLAPIYREILQGNPFSSGLGYRITTGVADNDVGSVALGQVLGRLGYS